MVYKNHNPRLLVLTSFGILQALNNFD